jgi:hypothetical protein
MLDWRMESSDPQRWARCPPHLAWKRPGLPTSWVRVLERHPEGAEALPGYVWLDMPGKLRHVPRHELEFQSGVGTLTHSETPEGCQGM